MSDKSTFIDILRKNVKRDGIEKLISMLEKTDFFTAPASTQYHDSVEGGLCHHSLNVYRHLLDDWGSITDTSLESITIVSLLHDLCKIGYYKVSTKNVKDESGKWTQVPFYMVDDKLPLGHGEKSIIMILQMMTLTTEEMMAIRWHMSGFEPKENYPSISKAYSEFPLAVYLHTADLKATYLK